MELTYQTVAARIRALGVEAEQFCLGKSHDKMTAKVSFDLTDRKTEDVQNGQYAIKYYAKEQVFFIWNLENHRRHDATLYLNASGCPAEELNSDTFRAMYKTYRTAHDNVWEKICIVGSEHFQLFFGHMDYWMRFNKYDREYPNNIKCAIEEESAGWKSERERREWSMSRKRRELDARRAVLLAGNYRCLVCGCDVPELLYPVWQENSIRRKHAGKGFCLCATHKVLYEQRMIDIAPEIGAVRCIDERAENFVKMTNFMKSIEK